MRIQYFPVVLGLLALAACDRKEEAPKPPAVTVAMPNLPLPPDGEFVSRSGSKDAVQLVFQSPATVDFVADYYRGIFGSAPWRLVGDSKDREGTIALMAEQNGPPMWVQISGSGRGSRVEITGAVPGLDTAFTRRAQGARDSSNTLRPLRR